VPEWARQNSIYFLPRHPDYDLTVAPSEPALSSSPAAIIPANGGHNAKGVGCQEYEKNTGNCEHYYAPGVSRYETGPHGEGGEVIHEPTVYLIYWGKEWETEEAFENFKDIVWISDTFSAIESQYGTDATYEGLLSQYHDDAGQISTKDRVAGSYVDESVSKPTSISPSGMIAEINKAISVNGWPTPNHNDQYVVLPSKEATWESDVIPEEGCGFHGVLNPPSERGESTSDEATFSFIPYQGSAELNKNGGTCLEDIGAEHTNKEWVEASRKETDAAAMHEYAESVTDPSYKKIRAWNNSEGYELADICQGNGGAVKLGPVYGAWFELLWSDEEADAHGNSAGCTINDPPAPPSPAPAASTEPATSVAWNPTTHRAEATLNAIINPSGSDTHYYFKVGTTEAYGAEVPYPSANGGFGEASEPVSAKAEDLYTNTTYHYRIVASSWAGTTEGTDHTFTTPYQPPEERTRESTAIGPTIATLNGEVEDEYGTPRTTYFEYGTTTNYGSKTAEVKESSYTGWYKVNANLTGLAPNTLYHYRLTSYTTGGTTHSADATFTTTVSPLAITEAARGVTATSAQLTATINPGGLSTTYQFEWWPTAKPSEVKDLPTTPASAGSGTANVVGGTELTGLTVHTSYSYRVKVTNSHSTTTGKTVSFTATPPFKAEPTPPLIEGTKENKLESVSCVSAIDCIATGTDAKENGMLAEHWNGNIWQTETIPVPETGVKSAVGAVSCWTTTECRALTGYGNAKGESFMSLATWDGTSWSNGAVFAEASGAEFTNIACVVTCYAAGTNAKETDQAKPLAAKLSVTGVLWEKLTLPALPTNEGARVTGLSCATANLCVMVGTYTPSVEKSAPFIYRWNGTSWALETSHLSAGSLKGVACPTATSCLAVGENGSELLADHWNGTEWTPSTPPLNGLFENGEITGVSCSSATYCVTSGGFESQIIDAWNNGEWQALSSEASSSYLNAVSCVASGCALVGSNMEKEHEVSRAIGLGTPYAETNQATNVGTGTATLHATVNPYGYETTYQFEYGPTTAYGTKVPATPGKLSAVFHNEALSASLTGLSGGTYHYRIAATNVDGTSYGQDFTIAPHNWALIPAPSPGGLAWTDESVSCTSTSFCIMVGSTYRGSAGELAYSDRWNGTEWTALTTTLPAGTYESRLTGVSCNSVNFCMAVGQYQAKERGPMEPLALHWNGSSWSVAAYPENAEANLRAVSCPTTTSCTTVGYTSNINNESKTLAEGWNGVSWKLQTTPNSSEKYNSLSDVSCTSATACMAAGYPYALHWNGTTWTAQSVGAGGVSCTSASWCEEVGEKTAASWNGTEWKSQPEIPTGRVNSVACSSETICTAMGRETLAGWNGSEWTLQTPLIPAGYKELQLQDIACASASGCMVVGDATNGAFTDMGVVESFGPPLATTNAATSVTTNGATLNASVNGDGEATTYHFEYGPTTSYGTSVPMPEGSLVSETEAEHVSQVITGLHMGTTYHYRVVALNHAGVSDGEDHTVTTSLPSWSIQSTPNPSGGKEDGLAKVACVSSTECEAVGGYLNSSGVKVPLAERWNGTEWTIQSTPGPSGAKSSGLATVTCSAASECFASGTYTNSEGAILTLAEHWNGKEWAIQSTPNPSGAKESHLGGGISCTSSTECTVVGNYVNSSGVKVPLAERWNGKEWSLQTPVVPGGAQESLLLQVSCTTATTCTAAGEYKNSSGILVTLAERWNGTEWTIQTTPNPSGAKESILNGITCVSSTECEAVGHYINSSGVKVTLAERWNGTEWTIQTTPNPSGAKESMLRGAVSCTSSYECTAAGQYTNSSGVPVTLVEFWNGIEWSIDTTPNPSGAKESRLRGLSCASALACTATGEYENSSGEWLTLAIAMTS
jgi:hypothetical protein